MALVTDDERLRSLARELSAGDRRAEEQWAGEVARLTGPVVRRMMSGRPEADVEDVSQQILVGTFAKLNEIADPTRTGPPVAYIRGIATLSVRLYFRKERQSGRRPTVFFSELGENLGEENVATEQEDRLSGLEEEETVRRFRERLNGKQKRIVSLLMTDYRPQDIQAELGLTKPAYQGQMRTIRKRLDEFIREKASWLAPRLKN
jgi:hypothetical protein